MKILEISDLNLIKQLENNLLTTKGRFSKDTGMFKYSPLNQEEVNNFISLLELPQIFNNESFLFGLNYNHTEFGRYERFGDLFFDKNTKTIGIFGVSLLEPYENAQYCIKRRINERKIEFKFGEYSRCSTDIYFKSDKMICSQTFNLEDIKNNISTNIHSKIYGEILAGRIPNLNKVSLIQKIKYLSGISQESYFQVGLGAGQLTLTQEDLQYKF